MNTVKTLFDQQYGITKWKFYDNIIKRFRCHKDEQFSQILPVEDAAPDTPIFACKFSQQSGNEHFLALANEDGKLAIHDTTNKTQRFGVRAHNNAIFDLAWMFNEMKIVTASGDHTTRLFDVSNGDFRELKVFYGHSRSVKTVAFRQDDPSVFATGGRDGNIILWDVRVNTGSLIGKADGTIYNSHTTKITPTHRRRQPKSPSVSNTGVKSVTGLVFRDGNTLVSCGAGDGCIKIWDLRKNYKFWRQDPLARERINYSGKTTRNGFSSLILDRNSLKLYASCLDNCIYSYDLGTFNHTPLMKYTGHHNGTFYVKTSLSNDGLYLMSGSSDENAYIWNVERPEPLVKLSGHGAEVTCVAWCERGLTAVTCSDDMTHKIWRIGEETLPDNWEVIGGGTAETLSPEDKRNLKRSSTGERLWHTAPKRLKLNSNENLLKRVNEGEDDEVASTSSKRFCSPRKLFKDLPLESPTLLDLPNYVIDGVAPHLNLSPLKKKKKDWLTLMRTERSLRKDFQDCMTMESPPAKMPKLDFSPKNGKKVQSPILKFFKVKGEGHNNATSNKGSPGLI